MSAWASPPSDTLWAERMSPCASPRHERELAMGARGRRAGHANPASPPWRAAKCEPARPAPRGAPTSTRRSPARLEPRRQRARAIGQHAEAGHDGRGRDGTAARILVVEIDVAAHERQRRQRRVEARAIRRGGFAGDGLGHVSGTGGGGGEAVDPVLELAHDANLGSAVVKTIGERSRVSPDGSDVLRGLPDGAEAPRRASSMARRGFPSTATASAKGASGTGANTPASASPAPISVSPCTVGS